MRTVLLLIGLSPWLVDACDGLRIDSAWLREAPPGAGVLAAYMSLHNAGNAPMRVTIGDADDFHHAMLHETVVEDGRASMQHVDALLLAPGETATLDPGGLHVMLHGPVRQLRAGDVSRITLRCGTDATILPLPVRKATR